MKLVLLKEIELRERPARKITQQIEDQTYKETEVVIKMRSGAVKQGEMELMMVNQPW